MTEPKVNPLTGHEDGLSDPRPRDEILKELLASYQVDSNTRLCDIFHRLEQVLLDLRPFVDKEKTELIRQQKRERRNRTTTLK